MTTQPLTDDEVRGLRQPWAEKATPLAPRIVATIDSLKADLEQALALLEKHEFAAEFHMEGVCPECVNDAVYDLQVGRRWSGHAPDCTWANLLSKYNREVRFHD